MQLALILAVLAALVISDSGPSQPVSGAGYRLLTAAVGMGLVAVFAAISSGLIAAGLRRNFHRRHVLLWRFKQLRRVHAVLWLVTAGGILWWLDWGQLVRFNWHLNRAFLVDDVLILTPVLLPMVLSWAAFYEVDHAIHVGRPGTASLSAEPSTRRRYLAMHLRHYLGILLLPVLGLLAVQDGAELLMPGVLQSEYAAAVYIPAFVGLFLFFPTLLCHVWQTRPLPPGPLRDRLEAAADRNGFRARDIRVWQTGGMVVNAAVAGFVPSTRYVFLTDGLLGQLGEAEIEAVFRHEVGHVRHHHLPLRILAMLAPLSLWLLVEQVLPGATERLEARIAGGGLDLQIPLGLLALAAMACYLLVVFGYYSRLLERQADLFACRTLGSGSAVQAVDRFVSALEKLAAGSGAGRDAPSWQHGSIARRVDFLKRVAEDSDSERRFHLRVRLFSVCLVGVVVSPLACRLLLA